MKTSIASTKRPPAICAATGSPARSCGPICRATPATPPSVNSSRTPLPKAPQQPLGLEQRPAGAIPAHRRSVVFVRLRVLGSGDDGRDDQLSAGSVHQVERVVILRARALLRERARF